MQHVPYKGTAPLAQDLLAGQMLLSLESSLSSAAPNVKAGKIKALAITASSRSPLLPDVPTVAEQGFPGFDASAWFGLIGPTGLPPAAIAKLNQAVNEGLQTAEVKDRFAQIGAEPMLRTPEQFGQFIRTELQRWGKVITDGKITLD
jgi:tripartite-type tricarboxylate transporter receptor subunit TctC